LPSLTIDEAAGIALAMLADGGEMDPEEAADVYVLEPPNRESVSPTA